MNFIQPYLLWGLVGLAVPLAIHLLSRKEGRTIRLGSLRHVRETSSRQFRSIRLNEVWLLLLRSIVVVLAVALMSGWYIEGIKENRRWALIERGLQKEGAFKILLDSLVIQGFELRALAPGFPEIEGDEVIGPVDYRGCVEELQQHALDSVVVLSRSRVVNFNGTRTSKPSHIRWITLGATQEEFELEKVRLSIDSLFVRAGISTPAETTFSRRSKSLSIAAGDPRGVDVREQRKVNIAIVADEGFETDRLIIEASLKAIQSEVPDLLVVKSSSSVPDNDTAWLIWLSQRPLPETQARVIRSGEVSSGLIEQDGERTYTLSRLNSETATTGNFAVNLFRTLFPASALQQQAAMWDIREMSDRAMWASGPAATAKPLAVGNDASLRYLLMALVVFILFERLVSYQRKQ